MHGDVLNFRNRLSRTDHIFNSISNFSTSANLLLKEFFYAPLARDVSATIFQDMHQDIEHHGGEFLVVRIPVPALGQYAYSIINSRAGLNGRVDNNVLKFIDLSGAISKHADARTRLYLNDPGTHFLRYRKQVRSTISCRASEGLQQGKITGIAERTEYAQIETDFENNPVQVGGEEGQSG